MKQKLCNNKERLNNNIYKCVYIFINIMTLPVKA